MIRKQGRGQDRAKKRTVEGKAAGSKRSGGKFSPKGKSEARDGKSRPERQGADSDKPFNPKSRESRGRGGRRPERFEPKDPESDKLMSPKGKVLRGKFGKRNLQEEQSRPVKKQQAAKRADDGSIRLNRFIANAGICSRREADTYIETGCVTVNGKVVNELGIRVMPGDEVSFNGQRLTAENKRYVLLNKPKGFVTTLEDPHADRTVMDIVGNACTERIYPVGRLDKATTGLLLLTNDGDLTKRLTHPKYNRKKIYHVFCDKRVSKAHLEQIIDGVTLEDGFVAADSVSYVDEADKKQVGIEIHSGKNRIVRRIFAHFGYKVEKLDRVYFCGLTKKNLARGQWRFLTEQEINILKMGSF